MLRIKCLACARFAQQCLLIVGAIALLSTVRGNQAHALLIDTFSDGTIPNTSAPPFQDFSQTGLSGVLGGGRVLQCLTSNSVSTFDLNSTIQGDLLLRSSGPGETDWVLAYGLNSSFSVDLTDGGLSNAFVIHFAKASGAHQFRLLVAERPGHFDDGIFEIPEFPAGGVVVVPFAVLGGLVNYTQVNGVTFEIDGDGVGEYDIESISTQLVPEPGTFVLSTVALASLLVVGRGRRQAIVG